MILVHCAKCSVEERFEDRDRAFSAGWSRLKLTGESRTLDWFCPRERSAITEAIAAHLAEGVTVSREGRILE